MKTGMTRTLLFAMVLLILPQSLAAYPFDGYESTGIRRLLRLQWVIEGKLRGTLPPPGGQRRLSEIKLNLQNSRGDSLSTLPAMDRELQREIERLFPERHESYSVAVLDITPGQKIRFAERQSERHFNPGSVGKLAIAAGLFSELARLYPDSPARRISLLRSRMVRADKWAMPNHHEVPVFDPATGAYAVRAVREGDTFSLYEWADHMLSASSNAAASMVWKELLLMRHFGSQYPPDRAREEEFFKTTPKSELQKMALSIVNDPLRAIGIAAEEWQLGSFFTATAKRIVPGAGSWGSPLALLKYLVALERGKIVDEWSSLEIKRLIYLTAKRIRYASAPRLAPAAVYFKSGSLYRCKPEPDFQCGKYRGNVENYMNSVAIVEHPGGSTYLVALMSNVLRKNSAVEHQSLATFIDRIIDNLHLKPAAPPDSQKVAPPAATPESAQ